MDITGLEPIKDAVWIQLRHPVTDAPLEDSKGPVRIQVYGIDSEPFQIRQRVYRNRLTDAQRKRSKDIGSLMMAEERQTLVACIAGWENIELDGKPLKFDQRNATLLLERLGWIQRQLDSEMADMGNFIQGSPTS